MYGVLISFGILLALLHTELLAKKESLDTNFLWKTSFWVIVFGLIGARLYHVIEYWSYYVVDPVKILSIWNGGMGIIGGIIFGTATLIYFLKKTNQPKLKWLDLITLNIPLAQAVGRWGNFFNKELIPYAIYESLLDIILFLFLLVLKSKKKTKPGTIFFVYLMGYSIIRIVLETTKSTVWVINGWSVVQIISAFILFLSVVCYSLIVRRNYDLSSK